MKKLFLYILFVVACIMTTYWVLQDNHDKKLEAFTAEMSADQVPSKRQELLESWKASQKFTLTPHYAMEWHCRI